MGFHADRPVVGLRTYFVLALLLGGSITALGLYAIFRADITDSAAREGTERPNIVVFCAERVDAPVLALEAEPLKTLAQHSLVAMEAYTACGEAGCAWDALRTGTVPAGQPPRRQSLDNRLADLGYTVRRFALPADDAALADWLGPTVRRAQPFFATITCARWGEDAQAATGALRDLLRSLDANTLTENTVLIVTALGGPVDAAIPDRWRVPLLVRYPRRFPNAVRIAAPVSVVDIAPTVEHLVGLPRAQPLPGDGWSVMAMRLSGEYRDSVYVRDGDLLYAGAASLWAVADGAGGIRALDGGETEPRLAQALSDFAAANTPAGG